MPCVRVAAVLSVAVCLALAGCMMQPSGDDWESYDSGRGLGFAVILSVLLIAGIVVLITNLSGGNAPRSPSTPQQPATPPQPPAAPLQWQPVEPRTPAPAKAARKPAKPRRATR